MNTEQLSPAKKAIVGVQFLFVAFGATVLVPLLIGINPATALFTAGVGTLIFHVVTKGRVPIFLGSSFAFIAPIIAATQQWGLPGTIAGLTSVSLVYFVMSALVKWQGRKLLDRLFPPVVIGPVIILIGLSLSGSAVNMAKDHWLLAFVSLITAILVLTLCKKRGAQTGETVAKHGAVEARVFDEILVCHGAHHIDVADMLYHRRYGYGHHVEEGAVWACRT